MNKFTIVLNTLNINDYEKYNSIDSFIVGDNTFGIRMPRNFTIKEIRELKKNTKKKIFVSINKIFHEYEIDNLKEYLLELKKISVDGIIFSDLAVYELIKGLEWEVFLSYSTDTTITSSSFTRLANIKGIDNVELAKELTLKEIKEISEKKESSITLFIHGHIYMYNSFRRIVSSYFDEEDTIINRDEMYLFDEEREAYYPILETQKGTNILSHYDQMSIKFIKDIFNLKIDYLKLDSFGYEEDDFKFIFKKYDELLKLFNGKTDDIIFDNKVKEIINEIEENIKYKKFNTGFLKKKTIF